MLLIIAILCTNLPVTSTIAGELLTIVNSLIFPYDNKSATVNGLKKVNVMLTIYIYVRH